MITIYCILSYLNFVFHFHEEFLFEGNPHDLRHHSRCQILMATLRFAALNVSALLSLLAFDLANKTIEGNESDDISFYKTRLTWDAS